MKTPKNLITTSRSGRHSRLKILALTAALLAPAAGLLAQTQWIGGLGTNDYNNASLWNPSGVPGGTINCTDDAGSNNVILIQAGDPAFQHGDTLAGNAANTSGTWLQTGSTNFTGNASNGNWLRLANGAGTYGAYILSNGLVQVYGQTHVGEVGTARRPGSFSLPPLEVAPTPSSCGWSLTESLWTFGRTAPRRGWAIPPSGLR